MALVVSCLGVAVGGTCRGIVPLNLTERMILVAHVSVLTLGIVWGVDGTAEFGRPGVARNCCWRRIFVVDIGSGEHNVEAISPLSCVGSFSS